MNKLAGEIDIGGLRGFGRLGLEGKTSWFEVLTASTTTLAGILSVIIGTLTVVAAIWFLFKIISGGIAILSSGGDKGKLADARSSITTGLVGLFIVIFAVIFVGFIGSLIGIDFLDIGKLITNYLPIHFN